MGYTVWCVRARVTPRGQGESLAPPYTRGSVSLSLSKLTSPVSPAPTLGVVPNPPRPPPPRPATPAASHAANTYSPVSSPATRHPLPPPDPGAVTADPAECQADIAHLARHPPATRPPNPPKSRGTRKTQNNTAPARRGDRARANGRWRDASECVMRVVCGDGQICRRGIGLPERGVFGFSLEEAEAFPLLLFARRPLPHLPPRTARRR